VQSRFAGTTSASRYRVLVQTLRSTTAQYKQVRPDNGASSDSTGVNTASAWPTAGPIGENTPTESTAGSAGSAGAAVKAWITSLSGHVLHPGA
jgi:hypothetical protein